MAYTPKTWTTGETITAAELNANEQGTAAAATAADTANAGLANKVNTSTYTAGLAAKADTASLAAVAQTGSYTDLANKPSIPAGLPTQTGNSGKFLTTDGTAASWGTPAGGSSGSSLPATVVAKTGAYTAATGDFVQANAATAGFIVTLPTAPPVGALVAVKKTDSGTNVVTVAPAASGTIDGDANATIITKNAGAVFEHTGANAWQVTAVTSAQGPKGDPGATGPQGAQGIQGIQGTAGTNGTNGTNGQGVPVGGTTGQILAKTSNTDYATGWIAAPTGGGGSITVQDEGSALTARASINFVGAGVTATDDAANSRTVVTIPGGGGGGSVNPAVRGALPTASLPGAFTETYPRWLGGVSGVTLGTGTPKLAAVTLYAGETATKAMYTNGGTAMAGGTHAWIALTDVNGTVLAVSADDTAPTWAATTNKTFTLASPYAVTTTGIYYLALCVVATTPPGPMTTTPSGALSTTPQPAMSAVAPSGATTPPTVGASLGTLVGQSSILYAAVA